MQVILCVPKYPMKSNHRIQICLLGAGFVLLALTSYLVIIMVGII